MFFREGLPLAIDVRSFVIETQFVILSCYPLSSITCPFHIRVFPLSSFSLFHISTDCELPMISCQRLLCKSSLTTGNDQLIFLKEIDPIYNKRIPVWERFTYYGKYCWFLTSVLKWLVFLSLNLSPTTLTDCQSRKKKSTKNLWRKQRCNFI